MESQPQNPDFKISPENFHSCVNKVKINLWSSFDHRGACVKRLFWSH